MRKGLFLTRRMSERVKRIRIFRHSNTSNPNVKRPGHVNITLTIYPYFHPVTNLHNRNFNRSMLLIGRNLGVTLCLISNRCPVVRDQRGKSRRVKIVFSLIRIRIVLIVIINNLMNVRMLLRFVFFNTMNFFHHRRVKVLKRVKEYRSVKRPTTRRKKAKLRKTRRRRRRGTSTTRSRHTLPVPFRRGDNTLKLLNNFLNHLYHNLHYFPDLNNLTHHPMYHHVLLLRLPFLPRTKSKVKYGLKILHRNFPVMRVHVNLSHHLLHLYHIPPKFRLTFYPPILSATISVTRDLLGTTFSRITQLSTKVFLLRLPSLTISNHPHLLGKTKRQVNVKLSQALVKSHIPNNVRAVHHLIQLTSNPLRLQLNLIHLKGLRSKK